MPAKKDPFTELGLDPPPLDGFAVTIEQEIGFVTFGEHGHPSPVHAAFAIIAQHIVNTGKGADGVYRFAGPHEDTEIVVTVEGSE